MAKQRKQSDRIIQLEKQEADPRTPAVFVDSESLDSGNDILWLVRTYDAAKDAMNRMTNGRTTEAVRRN